MDRSQFLPFGEVASVLHRRQRLTDLMRFRFLNLAGQLVFKRLKESVAATPGPHDSPKEVKEVSWCAIVLHVLACSFLHPFASLKLGNAQNCGDWFRMSELFDRIDDATRRMPINPAAVWLSLVAWKQWMIWYDLHAVLPSFPFSLALCIELTSALPPRKHVRTLWEQRWWQDANALTVDVRENEWKVETNS